MLGFRSEATRFEKFFKKIFGLGTRFGIIVFFEKNTRYFYMIFIFFQKTYWLRITNDQKMAIREKSMCGAL